MARKSNGRSSRTRADEKPTTAHNGCLLRLEATAVRHFLPNVVARAVVRDAGLHRQASPAYRTSDS